MCAIDKPGLGSVRVSPTEGLVQAEGRQKQSLGGQWFGLRAGGSAAPHLQGAQGHFGK